MHLEKELFLSISNWMKTKNGRGPREIKVILEETHLCVIFTNFLSPLEENYLKLNGDPNVLNEIRSFLIKNDNMLLKKIENIIKKSVKNVEVEINVKENCGKIIFEYGKMDGHGVNLSLK
ncbi:Na-translocating system protein MpsC family protein [Anaerobranca gottschalkii]|uniref:Uncharacterized protein YbcI n=1 Tax=Anaerobranca gottschalkii DSM 13577 TaxID=1120990 RepID=A0A1I0AUH3_9FIRM|nr:Na-translocating system protein MpsC family protein [Anaerobranca gottschalkii]SES97411.1 Uncharacterized protein YbcI [Anaerobranca gottschalkii DSM 13577]